MSHKDLSDLHHVIRPLSGGGEIWVLDTGALINPEAGAMTQALHSRSVGGIRHHLQVLADKGPENFMKNFYVGYGHKSIGDLGTTTIFIEGVSMLAAKAIQDWPLYSGQEASTRYIDFSEQPFIDPIGTDESRDILETWRKFYLEAQKDVIDDLKNRFPCDTKEDEKTYDKAINARAFDITRGLLPAGASTNVAWHSNLRQLADEMMLLRHHPLEEVREIAEVLQVALSEAHPNSFGHKRYEATEDYNAAWMSSDYYFTTDRLADFQMSKSTIDLDMLGEHREVLATRPPKTELPKYLSECGTVQFEFFLDFGSFRDIQRHRAVTQRMPLVTMDHGFGNWYLEELPKSVREEARKLITSQEARTKKLEACREVKQYYIAMGYQLPNRVTGGLPALTYLVELRSTRFVHPTLRRRAIQMAHALEERYKDSGYVVHLDPDPDRFDVKRGTHDIEVK